MIAIGSGESNICFMDMRGEKVLSPEDSKQFEFLIFGGVLGDHPPQDRVKDLR
jgi:ribosome biogenesis SPOUT family RNA methylase Rps3